MFVLDGGAYSFIGGGTLADGPVGVLPIFATEAGSGTDAVVFIQPKVSETGTGVEAVGIALSSGETGSGSEGAGIGLGVTETGTGTEGAGISLFVTETGSGTDAIGSIGLSVAEGGAGAEGAGIGVYVSETGTGVDVATITVSVFTAETGHGVDGQTVIIHTTIVPTVFITASARSVAFMAGKRVTSLGAQNRSSTLLGEQR
jgi:hypothetical protein